MQPATLPGPASGQDADATGRAVDADQIVGGTTLSLYAGAPNNTPLGSTTVVLVLVAPVGSNALLSRASGIPDTALGLRTGQLVSVATG